MSVVADVDQTIRQVRREVAALHAELPKYGLVGESEARVEVEVERGDAGQDRERRSFGG